MGEDLREIHRLPSYALGYYTQITVAEIRVSCIRTDGSRCVVAIGRIGWRKESR